MRLSTFSFSLIVCALLTVGYSVCILFLPGKTVPQNQFQENSVRAQRFLYCEKRPRILLLGSSMGARLPENDILQNMSFSGGGMRTGLEIMLRSKLYPKFLVVEMNDTVLREPDHEFINRLFHPIAYQLRSFFPVLREEFQPVSVFQYFLKQIFSPREKATQDSVIKEQGAKILSLQRSTYSKFDEIEKLDISIRSIKQLFLKIKKENIQIFIFDPPIHPELAILPRSKVVRERLKHEFQEYTWIDTREFTHYETTDGIHLTQKSALELTQSITSFLSKEL